MWIYRKVLEKTNSIQRFRQLTDFLFIERYFTLIENNGENEIISVEKIIWKCISITIDSDEYATYCLDTDEHD